jgi:hypothetical protein
LNEATERRKTEIRIELFDPIRTRFGENRARNDGAEGIIYILYLVKPNQSRSGGRGECQSSYGCSGGRGELFVCIRASFVKRTEFTLAQGERECSTGENALPLYLFPSKPEIAIEGRK